MRRKLRRTLFKTDVAKQRLVHKAEPADIDLVPGREDHMIGLQRLLGMASVDQIEHGLAVAGLGALEGSGE